MKFTVREIAEQVGGEVVGDGGIELAGFAQADAAKPPIPAPMITMSGIALGIADPSARDVGEEG